MLSGMFGLPQEKGETAMAEATRNLCAQIPVELHDKVRQRQSESDKTLSQYMTWLITKFYEEDCSPVWFQRFASFFIERSIHSFTIWGCRTRRSLRGDISQKKE